MAFAIQTPLKSVHNIGDTPWVVAPPDDLHDETLETEFCKDSEQFSDEDDDYESGVFFLYQLTRLYSQRFLQAMKQGNPPPAKKARKSPGATVKQSPAKSSRQKKSLSMLLALPLDVLFEVETLFSTHHTDR